MEKTKKYNLDKMPVNVIQEVYNLFQKKTLAKDLRIYTLLENENDEKWRYDNLEEYFHNLGEAKYLSFEVSSDKIKASFRVSGYLNSMEWSVRHEEKDFIEEIFQIIDKSNAFTSLNPKNEAKSLSKSKTFYSVNFPSAVIKKAYYEFLNKLAPNKRINLLLTLELNIEDEKWFINSIDEYFLLLPNSKDYYLQLISQENKLIILRQNNSLYVNVGLDKREEIENVFQIFEIEKNNYKIEVASSPIKIFIGHGHDSQWRDLKDHLHDMHGFDVIAYEIGPRAGLSVKEVIEDMLHTSSFALLVLTGEDIHTDGTYHARENVIHEVGLFQGKLNFRKAIVLLEDGVSEFSNILGINQIRFSKGNIKETFGDILATIKREFE